MKFSEFVLYANKYVRPWNIVLASAVNLFSIMNIYVSILSYFLVRLNFIKLFDFRRSKRASSKFEFDEKNLARIPLRGKICDDPNFFGRSLEEMRTRMHLNELLMETLKVELVYPAHNLLDV